MDFDPRHYGERVARVLALDGDGRRWMPLVASGCSSREARTELQHELPEKLFPNARRPSAAMAGLWLYFSAFEEAHRLAQEDHSAEGSLWHAILHRQEPDSGNSAYWFNKAGAHPTQNSLSREARQIVSKYQGAEFRPSLPWDPFGFILFCERAREQPGSESEHAALDIQLAEWQLLFDYCAKVKD
jgi:hypothetical protein